MRRLRWLPTLSACLLATCLVAGAQPAPPDADDHQAPPAASTRGVDPISPGMIADRPTARGLEYRRLTPIDPLEWETPNPTYRWVLRQIEAGVADARVMRLHHWLKSRLAPFDRPIPDGWRLEAWQRQQQASTASTDAASFSPVGRWIPVGPDTIPGRVTGLSFVPGRAGWILAGMADGGAWLTRDNGQSWDPLSEREATLATGAVAVDPRDPRVLYWGTGEGNGAIDNYGGIGVLRSDDGGRTWQASNSFSNVFRCLRVDPADSQRVFACGAAGLYLSEDRGANFSQVQGGLPTDAGGTDLLFRPGQPRTLFAALWGRGVWRSDDGGVGWSQVGGGLPGDLGRNVLAACESNPDVMVAAAGTNGGELWKSTDGGANWSQVIAAPAHCGGQCWYDNTVAIAPDDCETIYLGGVGFHISRDGGASWGGTSSGIHVDHHALLAGPAGEVVVGDDGGIYRSTDWGQTFTNISTALNTTQYYGSCGSDVTAGELAGGTQDRGTHQRREGQGWRHVLGGDGGMCAIAGSRILGEYQNTNLQRSLNGGDSFQDANSGIKSRDPRAWVGVIEKDPGDGLTLYVGTNRIYRTTDFHETAWDEIAGPIYFGRMVTTLAVSPADRNVLWAGFELGGVYRSSDALALNPHFSNAKSTLPNRNIRRIIPDDVDPAKAWVVLSGYGYPKILLTTDSGGSYTDVSGDFPDLPVNDLAIDPGDSAVLYAGTDLGVFRSADGGLTWGGFSEGLPLAAVIDLFRHPADGSLIAATHGRSMFRWRAAAGATGVPDGSQVPGSELLLEKTVSGELWLRFDSESCTASNYHLFHGLLANAATGPYQDADCDLPRGGETTLAMPGSATESLFFHVAAAGQDGSEGPHGYRSDGSVRPHDGSGLCGVTLHDPAATCP